jgi:hypothetical protein
MRGNITLSLILFITVINLASVGKVFSQTPTGRDSISLNLVPGGTYGYLNVSVWICRTGSISWNLGNSSFVFHYNNSGLSNPSLIQTGIGNGGNYNATSIHTYGTTCEGIDITLPTQYAGTVVPTSYTLVGTVQFQIDNPSLNSQIYWNNIYTSVSADDWLTYPVMTNIEPPATLSLKVYLEQFWNGTSQISDTVKVYLANSITPYALVDSATVVLPTTGLVNLAFLKTVDGNYYIVVKHRNHLETWSATPQTFNGFTVNYDFSAAATQAYGSNMILVGTIWCLISGDINQDGAVDALDRSIAWNDRNLNGYYASDLNGDNFVDALDRSICWNNRNFLVQKPVLDLNPINRDVKQDNKGNNGNTNGTFDLRLDGSNSKKIIKTK